MMMKTQTVTAPFRSRSYHPNRAAFEFYPTPPEATRALLSEVSFEGSIWEPACGEGAISNVLLEAGHEVVSTDLIDRGFGTGNVDFLKQTKPLAKNIITNPPYGYGLGDKFTKQALTFCRQTGGKVAMLFNLACLCHPKRSKAFLNTPPKAIYGVDELICFPYGDPSRATYSTAKNRYCWVVWEVGYNGRPEFWWLNTEKFRE